MDFHLKHPFVRPFKTPLDIQGIYEQIVGKNQYIRIIKQKSKRNCIFLNTFY